MILSWSAFATLGQFQELLVIHTEPHSGAYPDIVKWFLRHLHT